MSSLADLPELIGFFSYSREDDEDSNGALSVLRDRIQRELRGQLGRSTKTFRLWQDKEAIASGRLWQAEIQTAVAQAVFFIPIITPTVVRSPHCRFELESFLAREATLDRTDLVFPILYIEVPGLDDPARQQSEPVLSLVAKRQYLDWRQYRYDDIDSPQVKRAIGKFCANIRDTLFRSWLSPEERKEYDAAARERSEADAQRRAEEERLEAQAVARRRVEEDRQRAEADDAAKKRAVENHMRAEADAARAEEERLREPPKAAPIPGIQPQPMFSAGKVSLPLSRPVVIGVSAVAAVLLIAVVVWAVKSRNQTTAGTGTLATTIKPTPAPDTGTHTGIGATDKTPTPATPTPTPVPAAPAPAPGPHTGLGASDTQPAAPATPAPGPHTGLGNDQALTAMLTAKNIYGQWCGASTNPNLTKDIFAANSLTVVHLPGNTKTVLKVDRYEYTATTITVYYYSAGSGQGGTPGNVLVNVTYGNFSADGKTMNQLPNSQGGLYVFTRC